MSFDFDPSAARLARLRVAFSAILVFAAVTPLLATEEHDHETGVCVGADSDTFIAEPDDFFEVNPDGTLPQPERDSGVSSAIGAVAPASTQPVGALTGRIVYTSGGHGWTAGSSSWAKQRGINNEMNEDYGNMDQMTLFAYYCFNAGATVVPFRPVGHQTNEVVLDNDSPGVVFSGTWNNSSSSKFFGSAGDVPYRYASIAASETATATYTPNIPRAGFYPVYCWTLSGSDRTDQLYRIRHTGGESQVRIPHYMVGGGWIYLGTYYFNAGSNTLSGSVVISNLRPPPTVGSVVIADAIRFGNGIGDIDRGFGVSTYPREEEASRYWVQRALGQGQSSSIYNGSSDDVDDNVGTPPRMAREMNRHESGTMLKRVYIGFHSNAGGGRGCVGLYNNESLFPGTSTPNQQRLAYLVSYGLDSDMKTLPLEVAWQSRSQLAYARSDYAFGEINGGNIRTSITGGSTNEFDATIIEVAFHDHVDDAKLLRNPQVRNWIARSVYQGMMRYFNEFDALPLNFLPEPPENVRAIAGPTGITISWNQPVGQAGSGTATGYVVYRSKDGYGFGNPVAVSGVGTTSLTVTNLETDTDYYFRVAATNAGGESLPSVTVGCRRSSDSSEPKVLFVNAFDRFDRFINLRQNVDAQYKWPGHNGNTGNMDRVIVRGNNSVDYVVQHGKSINAYGMAFDSCQNETVANGQISLANYQVVIWASGQESTADETFSSTEQSAMTTYLNSGGALFASGSDIAWDLGRSSGPTSGDRSFLTNRLHARLNADADDDSGSYTVTPAAGSIFAGKGNATFDNGIRGIYAVRAPDILTPNGAGAIAALNYSGGSGGAAAVQYDGSAGGGRVVFLGFPFETIYQENVRNTYMAAILSFLSDTVSDIPPTILTQPQSQTVIQSSNATLSVVASGSPTLRYQWLFNGAALGGATSSMLTRNNAQQSHSGNYQVIVTNSFGMVTSQVATLYVGLTPTLQTAFTDTFDSNTAANWTVNKTSTDTRVTFNYNYANDGIAAAPNASGTTRGVKFEANMANGATAAINISPSGQNLTGDYRLHFDMWINANGPFPAGGTGSSEHITAGVATAGNRVQWIGSGTTADGYWFAVDGEGQTASGTTSVPDFAAFSGTTMHTAASGVYAAGTGSTARDNTDPYYAATFPGGQSAPSLQKTTYAQQTGTLAAGAVGFAWRDVIVNKRGSTVEWFVDGLKIATISGATFTGNNVFVGYYDGYVSVSDNAALSFGLVDNVRIERWVTNVPPFIVSQPKGQTVNQGGAIALSVSALGTTNLSYQWRRNGVNISGATASSYSKSNLQLVDAGDYSVVVTNIVGTVTSANATITVAAPPSITSHPQGQTVSYGSDVTFSVGAQGTAPLEYQWFFNGTEIPGATDSTHSILGVHTNDAGSYFVVVSNAAGSATSSNAVLQVIPPQPPSFQSATTQANNEIKLVLSADPGLEISIEYSIDLENWQTLTNLQSATGTIEFIDTILPNEPARFYRAVAAGP